jgi:hypothetical protein
MPPPERPDMTDQQIFDLFGVGTGDQAMRAFIIGQRKINGKLYVAIDKILDHLTKDGTTPDLEEAKGLTGEVPGEPPACCTKKTGCP